MTRGRKKGNIQVRLGRQISLPGLFCAVIVLPSAISLFAGITRTSRAALAACPLVRSQAPVFLGFLLALQHRGSRNDLYNILWAVVFGFATLNILSLAAKRFEPNRRGLSFGELMAVMVVLLSVFLLGWEMLNLFHIFPIRLKR
ncbi:MAG: hypothetical protein LAO24_02330 [Acidobacteriia bacterium]|nr:hypothetical protein [Terriglobia bacterium]